MRVGSSNEPILIADNVLQSPQTLIEVASQQVRFSPAWSESGGYPGHRANMPADYVTTMVDAFSSVVQQAFGLRGVMLDSASCNFSLVTQRQEDLLPLQRVPHVDTTNPLQFAFLHYLCDETWGGTAFYRHRSSQLEILTPDAINEYVATRDREIARHEPAAGYVRGSTDAYDQIGHVDAKFNRMVIYRSCLLHSGQILRPHDLSLDPRNGRLTANVFVNYRRVS